MARILMYTQIVPTEWLELLEIAIKSDHFFGERIHQSWKKKNLQILLGKSIKMVSLGVTSLDAKNFAWQAMTPVWSKVKAWFCY